jgi:hypothetical protein
VLDLRSAPPSSRSSGRFESPPRHRPARGPAPPCLSPHPRPTRRRPRRGSRSGPGAASGVRRRATASPPASPDRASSASSTGAAFASVDRRTGFGGSSPAGMCSRSGQSTGPATSTRLRPGIGSESSSSGAGRSEASLSAAVDAEVVERFFVAHLDRFLVDLDAWVAARQRDQRRPLADRAGPRRPSGRACATRWACRASARRLPAPSGVSYVGRAIRGASPAGRSRAAEEGCDDVHPETTVPKPP